MEPMFVLTVKRDGGTQDVQAFYHENELDKALLDSKVFLENSKGSKRAIIRLEYYNPKAVK